MMKPTIYLPNIPTPVPRLSYGCGNAKLMMAQDESCLECLDMAWEAGFRTFDSAHTYAFAEANLGRWIARHGHRDQMVLIGKGCNPGQEGCPDVFSGQTIREQLKETLDKLGTDHVDYYLLHRDDPSKPVDEIVETLNELKADGFITAFGGSNWTMARVIEANAYAEVHHMEGFTALSPCFSLADLVNDPWGGSVTISRPENAAYRKWLADNQMPVFNYSGLGRGFLSGKYKSNNSTPIEECLWWGPIREYFSPANVRKLANAEQMAAEKGVTVSQICLAWLLAQPMNLFPLISPTSEKHMFESAAAAEIRLTAEECRRLETIG